MRRAAWIIISLLALQSGAQTPAPKALSFEDFGRWNTLANTIISNDGNSVAFLQNPQQGDGVLIYRYRNQVADTVPRGSNVQFGPENNFLVFEINIPEEQLKKAKQKKVRKAHLPKDSLGILLFSEPGRLHKFPRLNTYRIPEENAQYVAISMEPKPSAKDTAIKNLPSNQKKEKDNNLVLFHVLTADTLEFKDVAEWVYSRKGSSLWFRRLRTDSTGTFSSVYVFDTAEGIARPVFSEKGWIKNLATDEQGGQCAFLYSQDTISNKKYALYAGRINDTPRKVVDDFTPGFPIGWAPSENGNLYFSADGTKLYFGTAVAPYPESGDSIPEEEKPCVDVWSWHEPKLQSQQIVEATSEKKRTYLAVFHLNLNRFIQLEDPVIREVSTILNGNGEVAFGYNELPYLKEAGWTGTYNRDYYLVDLASGIKREIADNVSYARMSPSGKYVVWYDSSDQGYYARSTDINNLEAVPLTQMIPVRFYDEYNDQPNNPSPYGIAGWGEDEQFLYIYDRYDIWRIDPAGERVPVCITKAFGRRNVTRLRYLKLGSELEYIPAGEEIILSAFDERTMSGGFFSARLNVVANPSLLMMGKYHFSGVRKAKNAPKLIWTRENVKEFPDLWRSDYDFTNAEKISEANPQQAEYVWPTVQMVEWTSFSGEKLKGLLYLPENLNKSGSYPMLVYFYERNAENLYKHQHPAPSRSVINKTFYTSNGYAVFVPDVTYRNGYPGESACSAVLSGTQYLLNTFPFLDERSLGLQGHSWGGYQIAYLISQSNLFAAAMAGAPVSNMTSAYGGIRWQTGLVRMFQYERQQSRIGGSLWEKPLQYIENSPLFSAPEINTPLLMMHNDADGAVPWSQGIELFVALRRLEKPVWLLNYNNEPHNLRATSWANRMDLSKRMFQFFNHYLRGYPMPEWMEKGIPAVEKGENLGY